VDISGGTGLGKVHVGVGVDPDQADLLTTPSVKAGASGDAAGRQRMVPPQDKRQTTVFECLKHRPGQLATNLGDLFIFQSPFQELTIRDFGQVMAGIFHTRSEEHMYKCRSA